MHIFKQIQKSVNPGESLSFPFQRNVSRGSAVTACEFWNVCEFLTLNSYYSKELLNV